MNIKAIIPSIDRMIYISYEMERERKRKHTSNINVISKKRNLRNWENTIFCLFVKNKTLSAIAQTVKGRAIALSFQI